MKTHVEVFREEFLNGVDLNKLWIRFNGDENPLNEEMIRDNDTHMSMSVGDVVTIHYDDGRTQIWAVKGLGWREITNE